MRSRFSIGVLVVGAVALTALAAGCAVDRSLHFSDGEPSDGLRAIEPVPFQRAWAREGVDFSRYDQVLPRFAGIAYRRPPKEIRTLVLRRANYPMPAGLNDILMTGLANVFHEAIDESPLQRAREAGPSVLLMRVSLVDLVVFAPLGSWSVDDRVWVEAAGTFTLVIDLYDSQSGELFARAAERRMISSETPMPIMATAGDVTFHSFRIFREWAQHTSQLLEELRQTPLAEAGSPSPLQLTRLATDH